MVASSGISVRLWRLYAQAWLVCLVFPIIFLIQTPLAPASLVTAAAGLAVFILIYTWFMWPHPLDAGLHAQSRRRLVVFAGLTVLVLGLSLLYGLAFLWLLVGVSAVAGVALSARDAFISVMALTLVTLGVGVWLSGGIAQTDWLHLLPLVLLVRGLGLDMTGAVRLADALRELHAARGELARRAVSDERLRLARDLHDLLGRSLSLIATKSELAGRLLEREPARAAQEIRELEQVARQALRDVREAVAGYRQPTLRGELDGARQLLEAAGVRCALEYPHEPLPQQVDAVLAWAVREGVTNVIRHSRARRCAIRVSQTPGLVRAEVSDDGGPAPASGPAQPRLSSGLAGLRERVSAQGGRMEAAPAQVDGHPGFRLWVELPTRGAALPEPEPSR